ncbi:MAG TPA: hypothetical protein VL098_12555 [Flavipsychrobacter sp.]|nr:hypothetical protein [Flavipsychrobacter sp.]
MILRIDNTSDQEMRDVELSVKWTNEFVLESDKAENLQDNKIRLNLNGTIEFEKIAPGSFMKINIK